MKPTSSARLLNRTKDMLDRCTLSSRELHRRSHVGYDWLVKFRAEPQLRKLNPTVRQLQQLHDFLVLYHAALDQVTAEAGEAANSDDEEAARSTAAVDTVAA
jgi:hypothetical protein